MRQHPPKPLVLCEGKEDRLVMAGLARHAGLEGKLVFQDYGGEANLRRNLATLRVSPEFCRGEYARVLVTRDADADFNAAWASVTGSIKTVFSCEPRGPGDWVDAEGGVPITAWVVPGPGMTGMIETLCLNAARSRTPEMFDCLDPFVKCLERVNDGIPHEKVRFALWTIIAQGRGAQDRLSLDRALVKLDLAWDDEAFAPLKEMLVMLAE